jgi:hypothetical protein
MLLVVGKHEVHFEAVHGALLKPQPATGAFAPAVPPAPKIITEEYSAGVSGRADEVQQAAAAIERGQAVEVHGPDGSGKSSFLRYLLHNYDPHEFPDGPVYRRASGWSAADIVRWLFGHFFATQSGYVPTDAQQHRALQDKRALILLDDVDMTPDELDFLINVARHCVLVIAARRPLLVGDRCSVALGGLPLGEAVQVLEQHLGDRELDTGDWSAAQQISTVLEFSPLRIVQIAALMREDGISPAQMAVKLSSLNDFEQYMLGSLRRLSTSHLQILGVLATLGNTSITVAQLYAITKLPDAREVLIHLWRLGLGEDGVAQAIVRYRELLTDLSRRGLVEEIKNRYRLSCDLVEPIKESVSPEWPLKLILYFRALGDKHRNAPEELLENCEELLWVVQYVVEVQQWADALAVARHVEASLALSGRWDAWGRVLEWAKLAAQKLGEPRAEAWVLHEEGVRAFCLEDFPAANDLLTSALRMREAQGDSAGIYATRHNLDVLSAL